MKNILGWIQLNWDTKNGFGIGNFIISYDQLISLIELLLRVAGIIILMYLTIKVGSGIINRVVAKQKNLKFSLNEKKSKTVGAVLKSILRYAVYFFGIVGILTQFFGTISITFAGIGGAAIGFGAQSLIKDIINGFFILFEDQFAVGDYINIGDKAGIVESVELRVTKLRDFSGDLHIIPNGSIDKVTNHSRGNIRVMVDIDIDRDEDFDKVKNILSKVCEEFKIENKDMVDGPSVVGVSAVKENSLTVRIVGKSKPMKQWDCEVKLREEIKRALDKENISVPYMRRKLIKEE